VESLLSSRVKNTDFGDQAVALDDKYEATEEEYRAWHKLLKDNGVKIVAPPMWMLVKDDPNAEYDISPSAYADSAKEHGLKVITWTLERTGPGLDGWYWQSVTDSVQNLDYRQIDGHKFALLYVLSQEIGVLGVSSSRSKEVLIVLPLCSNTHEISSLPRCSPIGQPRLPFMQTVWDLAFAARVKMT